MGYKHKNTSLKHLEHLKPNVATTEDLLKISLSILRGQQENENYLKV
jgi:hypothetical protein